MDGIGITALMDFNDHRADLKLRDRGELITTDSKLDVENSPGISSIYLEV